MQMLRDRQCMETIRARLYLVTLQLMFLTILVVHLSRADSITRPHGIIVTALGISTLILFAVPRNHLAAAWFVALLSLGDLTVLLHLMWTAPTIEPWMMCEFILLMVAASYSHSVQSIVLLSGLITASYVLVLYRLHLVEAEAALLLPVLLFMTMTFTGKMRDAQTVLERMTETEEQTRYKTMIDALTGLPNRAQFIERVSRSIQFNRVDRDFEFAVLFIDLDGFKPINDRLGHKAGDAVLRHMAKRFKAGLRKGDTVARYGGDEFTLLINNIAGDADAIRVAERILRKLKDPIDVGEPIMVGASIGIALSTNLHEHPEDLIRDADGAMYRAKSLGKNQYVFSDQARDIPKEELADRLHRVVRARW
jgi:diguanylate cyclase (GGDEF)-like protein